MSLLTTALFALTSLTGVATSNKVDTTVTNLTNVCSMVNEEYTIDLNGEILSDISDVYDKNETIVTEELELDKFNCKDLLYYNDLYTLKGYNTYLEVVFNDKYVIYNKSTNEIEELGLLKENPYLFYEEEFKIYSDDGFDFKYLVYLNDEFINIETFKTPDFTEVFNTFQSGSYSAGDYIQYSSYPSNATKIDDEFYFRNLRGGFGSNTEGVCGIISSQVILGYMNFFHNDNIVEEQFEGKSNGNSTDISQFIVSPCTGNNTMDAGNNYKNYLIALCHSITGYNVSEGMDYSQQYAFLKEFFEIKNLNVSFHTSEGNFADVLTNRAKDMIRNAINNNRPCIANGAEHSMVAYAFCNDFVYVETGLADQPMKTPWDTFKSGLAISFIPTVIDIEYNDVHVCSNDYHVTTQDIYICPCQS